jgi:hypothetical protein
MPTRLTVRTVGSNCSRSLRDQMRESAANQLSKCPKVGSAAVIETSRNFVRLFADLEFQIVRRIGSILSRRVFHA